MRENVLCCCGSSLSYDQCCGPFLEGKSEPGTPEQLMRSRFSAFCIGNVEYLVRTHHPSARDQNERESLAQTIAQTKWLALVVMDAPVVKEDEPCGFVRFAAFFESGTSSGQLHERSRFVWEDGRWFYMDGEILPPVVFKRNEPCWCGRGRKFKKCHGR